MADTLADLVVALHADFGDTGAQLEGLSASLDSVTNSAAATATVSSGLAEPLNTAGYSGLSVAEAMDKLNSELDPTVVAMGGVGDAAMKSADAMASATDASTALAATARDTESATGSLSSAMAGTADAIEHTAAAADSSAESLHGIAEASHEAGSRFSEAHEHALELLEGLLAFAGIELGIELVKELGEEMIAAADKIDHTVISLTALTGDAEGAIETVSKLEELAREDALAFPALQSAAQRMTAFLGPTADVVEILSHVADGAAATGNSIDAAAAAFDRIAATGVAMGRSLMALGITTQDLADAMGTTEGAVKEAFKALDQSERIDVLTEALGKFDGIAGATAETVSGRWQQLKNDFETAMIAMGESVAPLLKILETLADTVINIVGGAFTGLTAIINTLGQPFGIHIQTTHDAETAAAKHALAVIEESQSLKESTGAVTESGEAHALASTAVLAHSHEIQNAADTLARYHLASVEEAKALLESGEANVTTAHAVGAASATLAQFGLTNVEAAAQVTALANAQLFAVEGAGKHADAIHEAAKVLESFGITTTAEADALDKVKGEHDAVTAAVQAAAGTLEKYGITTTAAAEAVNAMGEAHSKAKGHVVGFQSANADLQVTLSDGNTLAEAFAAIAKNDVVPALGKMKAATDDLNQGYGTWVDDLAKSNSAYGSLDSVLADSGLSLQEWIASVNDSGAAIQAISADFSWVSSDLPEATQTFFDLSQGMAGASSAAKGFGADIADAASSASTSSNSMITGLGGALDSVITGASNAGDAFLKFGESLLKTVTDVILKGAIEPLLGGLSSVGSSIANLFGGGGGGAGGGGIGKLFSGAVSGLTGIFSSVLSGIGGAIPSIVEAFGGSHQDTLLARIEENTRYLNIEFFQNAPHMWTDALTAGVEDIRSHIAQLTAPVGASGGHATSVTVSINLAAGQNPQDMAKAIADYLRTISPVFSVTTV